MSDNQKLVDLIKTYQELRLVNWPEAIKMSDEFLNILFNMDPSDIFPRAVIRYLMSSGGWPLGVKVENVELWSNVLEKFFGASTGGNKLIPENYLEVTFDIIKQSFDYEAIVPVTVKAETPTKTTKAKKATKKTTKKDSEEGESGSKIFKSIAEMEAAEAEG